jgi:hypothetical protein
VAIVELRRYNGVFNTFGVAAIDQAQQLRGTDLTGTNNNTWITEFVDDDVQSNYLTAQNQANRLWYSCRDVYNGYLAAYNAYQDALQELIAQLAYNESLKGGSPVPQPESEDSVGNLPEQFGDFAPPTLEIGDFNPVPQLLEDIRKLEEARTRPKLDYEAYFAKKTDVTDSFSPTVHQNNTLRKTVPITPFFKNKDNSYGETEEHREQGSTGRETR